MSGLPTMYIVYYLIIHMCTLSDFILYNNTLHNTLLSPLPLTVKYLYLTVAADIVAEGISEPLRLIK